MSFMNARDALEDYYGTGAFNGFPAMMMEVIDVDSLSDEEVRERAEELGLDFEDEDDD